MHPAPKITQKDAIAHVVSVMPSASRMTTILHVAEGLQEWQRGVQPGTYAEAYARALGLLSTDWATPRVLRAVLRAAKARYSYTV